MTSADTGPGSGLASQADAPSEEVAYLYETWVADGAYDRDVEEWGYEAPEQIADMAVAALAVLPGEVLDAGCGTGRVGTALHRRGVVDVVGGDFSPTSLDAARARGVYSAVEHLDLNAPLRFADRRFAATVSAGVFTYVTDTAATLAELLRIVRPGGAVGFTQRTDLWVERDCASIVERLVDSRACSAAVSDEMPYLPHHPDFGDDIRIRYVTLTKRGLGSDRQAL